MAAIIGRGAVMDAAQQTFVSSTYWTESIGPTATLATLAKLKAVNAVKKIHAAGERTRQGWRKLGEKYGFKLKVGGLPALATLAFDHGDDSRALMTLFTQEMLERSYLANGVFYPMVLHTRAIVDGYLDAADSAFAQMRAHIDGAGIQAALHGPVHHSGFARLT
jgi:glutamate-1-semialdehyde aminotransferase